jgi:hypothetical protein
MIESTEPERTPSTDLDPEQILVLVLGCERTEQWAINIRALLSHLDGGAIGLVTHVAHPSGDRLVHLVTLDYTKTTGHMALDVSELLGFDAHLTNFAGERL